MSAALRKWFRLVPVIVLGALLVGSMLMAPPALAQSSNTLQDNVPGSLLVYPIFDVFGANRTKIRVTCNGVSGTTLRLTYICQPSGTSTSSLFCPSFDENVDCTSHQTLVFDVFTQLFGACPTGQGYVVVWAEAQCDSSQPSFNGATCATATGGTITNGEFAPISYNQLFGSYFLYYNGSAAPGTCGIPGAPCA